MNLGELRAAVRDLINDEAEPYLWLDETLDRYANNAVREACIRARLLKEDADTMPRMCQLSVTAGTALVPLAPEVLVVRSGQMEDGCHKLWALTAESMDRYQPNWDSTSWQPGTPQVLVMDLAQKTMRLWPTPDANGTLRLRVWRMPLAKEEMVEDDHEPVIKIPDVEELKHWVAHEAYLRKDVETYNPKASGDHLALFEQRFGSRPSLHEMARWADSPPRVRHAVMY